MAICLAPQNSRTSIGLYKQVLAISNRRSRIDFVESWHDHPLLIQAFADKHRAAYARACAEAGTELPTLFTAHSVPQRTIADGDPYESQARETAALVAERLGLTR